jgi:hypothetical protein
MVTITNLPEDTYTVTVDINGYQASRQVQVDNMERVDAAFLPTVLIATVNQDIMLINSSTGAAAYNWAFGDGNSSVDANPVHQYSQAGEYEIILNAVNNDCQDTYSQLLKVQDIANGVNSLDESGIRIYSNGDKVFITFNNYKDAIADVMIYDLLGRKIQEQTGVDTKTNNFSMPVKNIADGYYFVEVTSANASATQKIHLSNK